MFCCNQEIEGDVSVRVRAKVRVVVRHMHQGYGYSSGKTYQGMLVVLRGGLGLRALITYASRLWLQFGYDLSITAGLGSGLSIVARTPWIICFRSPGHVHRDLIPIATLGV